MRPPMASICVTTHNDERWVDDCIRSALAQTYADFEVVVVDDASSDDTAAILRGHRSAEVRVVQNRGNRGEARSMNRAVALARGKYIKFLHGDDLLDPRFLECTLPIAEREGVGLVVTARHLLIDPTDVAAAAWSRRYGRIHDRLGPLKEVNPGHALFRRYLAAGLLINGFGEPSGAVVPRKVLEHLGG